MRKILLSWFLVTVFFAGFFLVMKSEANRNYETYIATIPNVQFFGSPESGKNIETFGIVGGFVAGFMGFIPAVIVYFVFTILDVSKRTSSIAGIIVGYGAIMALGYELIFLEEMNSAFSSAIVLFLGKPLFFSSVTAFSMLVLMSFIGFIRNKQYAHAKNQA